ncbi:bifunctional glycosyltransferase family 2/GtrA family protein [Nakamurella deserti]|uniref:bifunctional glycosyltransferase family 2/GtrA family protein n=1 Tax=Nakamurella deserti TaxID=2164074 RepID=UPI000DBE40ED|nr:bifunctional glycosyltransferase family 2/GtrA family protein [Nakamurella deserti]
MTAAVVLVPAYEPGPELLTLIRGLHAADPDLVVVVVDDGSGPGSGEIFATAAGLGCLLLTLPDNRGKGQALKTGFAEIAHRLPGRTIVCADADGQHRVSDILRVADAVGSTGADMVLGERRFTGVVPLRSRLGNGATRLLFRLTTGRRLHDTQTGLRGYPPAMLGWLRSVRGDRYEYELNLLLQACRDGRSIAGVDIATVYLDDNRSSHFRPVVDSVRIWAPLLRFAGSSLTAFAIDAVALLALTALTGSLLLSVLGARLLSATVNFAVNRRVVFDREGRRPVGPAAVRYAALVAVLLTVNYSVLAGLTALAVPLPVAKVATEIALAVLGYTAQSRYVFAGRLGVSPSPAPAPDAGPPAARPSVPARPHP